MLYSGSFLSFTLSNEFGVIQYKILLAELEYLKIEYSII